MLLSDNRRHRAASRHRDAATRKARRPLMRWVDAAMSLAAHHQHDLIIDASSGALIKPWHGMAKAD